MEKINKNPVYKRILIKISGESLFDEKKKSILDAKKLEIIADIVKQISKKNVQIGIVVGAGNIYRGKQTLGTSINSLTGDYMGMMATVINAIALKDSIEKKDLKCCVMTSIEMFSIAEFYNIKKANSYINEGKIVIFAGGTGNPCFTTDTAASLRAIEINAQAVFMVKNGVDGVYTNDPLKNRNAKLIKKISFQEIVDKKIKIMDLTALTLLMTNSKDIKVHVFNLDKNNFIKIINGDPDVGTLVFNK